MQQTEIKRKVLSDCVLKIKADEEVQNQKYHEVNEIKVFIFDVLYII